VQGWAQLPALHIKKTTERIVVDAEMSEAVWSEAEVAKDFKQFFPFDSSYAKAQTEVRMTYDDNFIYVFAIMHNLGPRKYITPSLRRDFRGEANDSFVVQFDTYQDKTNSFQFGSNPFGVQREGLVANGGNASEDLQLSWDNKWYSQAKILNDKWVCEFAIPFKTIRYKHGLSAWNINFYRIDSEYTERSTWSPIPRFYPLVNLAFSRQLIWDEPLKHPGGNISVIPYSVVRSNQDFEEGQPAKSEVNFGGDAKIAVSPALNLDLTVNPDFSQVEVDQQVTNLSRFEIFFPERRQFFLENADLFGSFGLGNSRAFFSRRIGVTVDPSTKQNLQNKIYGGFRLSGKINNKTRIGLLSMQAAEDNSIGLPSTNYTVAAIQRKVFARSNVGIILINKDAVGTLSNNPNPGAYNRLVGIDYNLASRDNRWTGKAFYHQSFDQIKKNDAYSTSLQLTYQIPKIEFDLLVQDVGVNFNPEVGYTPRKNFRRVAPEFYYTIYPKSKIINNHGPGTDIDIVGNNQYGITDWDANIWYKISFQNTSNFSTRIRRDYVYLFNAFDPTNTDTTKAKLFYLPKGSEYYYNSFILNFQSNARKKLFYILSSRSGGYFNGTRINLDGTVSYRMQPHAIISLDFSFNRITLPQPYKSADLVLLSPRFDFTFSRKLFWTTFVQYNNQANNVNINSRLQWRFKPVSDLFLVYTDNYFVTDEQRGLDFFQSGQPKLRAIVLKFTYWLNL
jgi:hypothetical protein